MTTSDWSRRQFIETLVLVGAAGITCRSWASAASDAPGAVCRREICFNTPWLFSKENRMSASQLHQAALPEFDDHAFEPVGIPHCYNDVDTFQNAAHSSMTILGSAWYRKRFTIDRVEMGRKLFVEFLGVNTGTAVYVNGKLLPGNTSVPQPGEMTHVGCFIPFTLDITDLVKFDRENVIAVRVGNGTRSGWFADSGFGTKLVFGMGFGGIVCPVTFYSTAQVHIPSNSYSPLRKWGTYFGTVSASVEKAQMRLQTNVENEGPTEPEVTLITTVLDSARNSIVSLQDSRTIKSGEIALFDQTATIDNPQLWYPNNSPYGKPHLYRVVSSVMVDGVQVDSVENALGIRMITWDDDYCYVNGHRHILNGFGHRNIYPALGSAVPANLQWRDIRLIAETGGNVLRVGHVPAFAEIIKACDAYGIMVLLDSGDNEWALKGEPQITYKKEYDRDMIIRFRNHTSIAVWESNNGLANPSAAERIYSPKSTIELVDQWDFIQPRIVGSRDKSDYFPADRKLMIGYTNKYFKVKGSPSINWEAYFGNWARDRITGMLLPSFVMARFDYDSEKSIADHYIADYLKNLSDHACGWIWWMLAETQGEGLLTCLDGVNNERSLGSCALDGNRLPKLTYHIFKNAVWIPFAIRPGVALQSHWNYWGQQDVDAWSNCPRVELFLNGLSKGVRVPDDRFRCTWKGLTWESGSLKAVGLDADGKAVCSDERNSSGPAKRIVLTAEPPGNKPSGEPFRVTANGSDVTIVTAKVVDAKGVWCPLANNNLRFTVSGDSGCYRGSYNFLVTPDKPLTYHAPGDPQLQAEGGLMRIAIRSTFTPGTVNVQVQADGLESGAATFSVG